MPGMRELRQALASARVRFIPGQRGITAVYLGHKWMSGARTDEVCIVVVVEEKKPESRLRLADIIPRRINGVRTDVIAGKFKALFELKERVRPVIGGYSCGHPDITAGTCGVWVQRNGSNGRFILSNNHVLANSNKAEIGDETIQPGTYDSGRRGIDRVAKLTDFVQINFPARPPRPPKPRAIQALWKAWLGVPNIIAAAVGCPYRAKVEFSTSATRQDRNLVDAAIAEAIGPEVISDEIYSIGAANGIRDLVLNDKVRKAGRTTGLTDGYVDGIGGSVSVSYGDSGTATFEDQVIIRSQSGEFSAGGDSGSAIVTEDGFVGGLLFAGGDGMTIANRISHIVSLLGVQI